jgi:hypothetical protein
MPTLPKQTKMEKLKTFFKKNTSTALWPQNPVSEASVLESVF